MVTLLHYDKTDATEVTCPWRNPRLNGGVQQFVVGDPYYANDFKSYVNDYEWGVLGGEAQQYYSMISGREV